MLRGMWAGRELRNRDRAPARLSFRFLRRGGSCHRNTLHFCDNEETGVRGAFAGELWALQPLWWQRNLPEGAHLWSVRAACCSGDEETSQREPPDEQWRLLGPPTRWSACYDMENSTPEEEKSLLALTLQSPSSALYWQSLTSSKGEMYFAGSNSIVIK